MNHHPQLRQHRVETYKGLRILGNPSSSSPEFRISQNLMALTIRCSKINTGSSGTSKIPDVVSKEGTTETDHQRRKKVVPSRFCSSLNHSSGLFSSCNWRYKPSLLHVYRQSVEDGPPIVALS